MPKAKSKAKAHVVSRATKNLCNDKTLVNLPVGQEGANDGLGGLAYVDVIGEDEGILVVHDLAVGADEGLGIEWGLAEQHLVEDDADRPPVALAAVLPLATLGSQDLGADVIRGADGCLRPDEAIRVHLHAGAEIGKLQVAIGV